MAKKKEETAKVVLEREYTVPLRKEFLKVAKNKRAKKAVNALREFMQRHMKSDNIIIGDFLNKEIWSKGIRNPPHHIKVKALKYEDGKVYVNSINAPVDKKEDKEDKKKKSEVKKPELKKDSPKAEGNKDNKDDKLKSEKTEPVKKDKQDVKKEEKKETKPKEKALPKKDKTEKPSSKPEEKKAIVN